MVFTALINALVSVGEPFLCVCVRDYFIIKQLIIEHMKSNVKIEII